MAVPGTQLLLPGEPAGYQKLTVADTAVALTVPANANRALLICETATLRFKDNGDSPTTTDGMLIQVNQSMVIDNEIALGKFKAIRTGGTSATLHISYYKK